ncbi:hypothetical protein C8Q77DRAFT_1201287 [Trametes polyzona]|nr:hypothetical protein C8Q77DRAFT_1201287 [Trametes polyzona]
MSAVSVLSRPNVLARILRHTSPPRGGSEKYTYDTVAKCARVCQAFREPALSVLWERLPSILPLFQLLSPKFGRIEGVHEVLMGGYLHKFDAYTLYDIPDDLQWARFCYYAQFVRVLRFHRDRNTYGAQIGVPPFTERFEDSDISSWDIDSASDPGSIEGEDHELLRPPFILPPVWYYLRQLAGDQPLFPYLQELEWTTSPFSTDLLDVLSPSVRWLHVRLDPTGVYSNAEWSGNLPLLIRSAIALAPRMQHFEVTPVWRINTLGSILPEVHRMTNVWHLVLDTSLPTARSTTAQALREAKLETLVALELLRIGIRIDDDAAELCYPISLHALRSLTIVDYLGRPEAYALFDAPNLRVLDFSLQCPVSTNAYCDTFAALVRQFPEISELSLEVQWTRQYSHGEEKVDLIEAIQPLGRFAALRTLTVNVNKTPVMLSSAEVRAFLQLWPHLHNLTVDTSRPVHRSMSPRVDVLMDIARFGTALTECRLSNLRFTGEEIDIALVQAESGSYENASLEALWIGCMLLDEAGMTDEDRERELKRCAKVVLELFPNLSVGNCRTAVPEHSRYRDNADWNTVVLDEVQRLQQSQALEGEKW